MNPEKLSAHDLVYEIPAHEWAHGAPIGNGMVGAMVWGDGQPLYLTLDHPEYFDNRQTVSDDPRYNYATIRKLVEERRAEEIEAIVADPWPAPRGRDTFPPFKVAVGWIEIGLPDGITVSTMRLHLADARLVCELSNGGRLELIAHAELPVICLRATDLKLSHDNIVIHTGQNIPATATGIEQDTYWATQSIDDGGCGAIAWRLCDGDAELMFYATVCHTSGNARPEVEAVAVIDTAAQREWQDLLAEHTTTWAAFWECSTIALPDARLEALWHAEFYKLNSCSRKGELPPNLQGLWPPHNQRPPWGGIHANNINTQMHYWPVYAANHPDLLEPFHDWLTDDQLPTARDRAGSYHGFEGAFFPVAAVGRRGIRAAGWGTVKLWPTVGAWWCQHMWLAYLYWMDEKFLKNRAYPFMRECMVFYEQLLEPDENGVLHVPVTHSPEWQGNLPEAWCSDSTIDLALIKYAARASAEAAARVGAKDEQSRWQHLADHLAPYPEDPEKWGLQLFPGQDLIESHHHHSHAAPIYPCGDLNIEGSDLDRDLIDRTLHALEFRGTGGWIGFSFSWMACIAARLGRGNQVWRMLQLYMDAFISPNTFNLNGDFKRLGVSCLHYDAFCMEAGPAAAAGILEMLLQSWKRIIRVFPALPEHWRDVSFEQLRAEGAFLVSATMAGGQITEVRIESERGGVCRVKNTFGMEMVLLRNEDETPCRGELIEWESQPGETSWIRPSEPATRAERRDAGQRMTNPFGLKTPETCARLSLTVAPNDVSDKP